MAQKAHEAVRIRAFMTLFLISQSHCDASANRTKLLGRWLTGKVAQDGTGKRREVKIEEVADFKTAPESLPARSGP
jgi:hypothetical protein